jgi:hypothetical protein
MGGVVTAEQQRPEHGLGASCGNGFTSVGGAGHLAHPRPEGLVVGLRLTHQLTQRLLADHRRDRAAHAYQQIHEAVGDLGGARGAAARQQRQPHRAGENAARTDARRPLWRATAPRASPRPRRTDRRAAQSHERAPAATICWCSHPSDAAANSSSARRRRGRDEPPNR